MFITANTLSDKLRHIVPLTRNAGPSSYQEVRIGVPTHDRLSQFCEFTVTNGSLVARTYCAFDGDALTEDAVVHAETLLQVARKLKRAKVRLSPRDASTFEVSAPTLNMTLAGSAESFEVRHGDEPKGCPASAAFLRDILAEQEPYISADGSRANLAGLFVTHRDGHLVVAATDGHRLCTRSIEVGELMEAKAHADFLASLPLRGVIICRQVVALARKLIDVDSEHPVLIGVRDEVVTLFQRNVFRIDAPTIDGTFPDFEMLLPKPGRLPTVQFDGQKLVKALEVGSVFAAKTKAATLTYNGDVRVHLKNGRGEYQASLEGKFDGGEAKLAFNYQYLVEAMKTLGSDLVCQHVNDKLSPQVFVRANDDALRVVIMPLRL